MVGLRLGMLIAVPGVLPPLGEVELLNSCCERLAGGGRDRGRSGLRLCSRRGWGGGRAGNCHIFPVLALSDHQGYQSTHFGSSSFFHDDLGDDAIIVCLHGNDSLVSLNVAENVPCSNSFTLSLVPFHNSSFLHGGAEARHVDCSSWSAAATRCRCGWLRGGCCS